MHTVMTLDATVDEIVAGLAERRLRERAYLALARAILMEDASERDELESSAA